MRPATEPVMIAGVITANIIWNIANTIFGTEASEVYPSVSETPSKPSHLKSPIIPFTISVIITRDGAIL